MRIAWESAVCSLRKAHHNRSNFLERVRLGMAVELSNAMQCQNAGSAENFTVRYSEVL